MILTKRFAPYSLIACLLCLLVSCTAPENVRYSSLDKQNDPSTYNGMGYVGLAVSVTSEQLDQAIKDWHEIQLLNLDTGVLHIIERKQALFNDTDIYLGVLPPGRYRLERLHAYAKVFGYAGRYSSDQQHELASRNITFHVNPGDFVNLGGLAYQPPQFLLSLRTIEEQLDMDIMRNATDHYIGTANAIRFATDASYRIFLAGDDTRATTTHYQFVDIVPATPQDFLRQLHSAPLSRHDILLNDGRRLITGRAGFLLIENTDLTWHLLPGPTFHETTAASLLPNGNLIIGTEFGELYRYSFTNRSWRALDLPLPPESISLVDTVDNETVVVAQHQGQRNALRQVSLINQQVNTLATFRSERDYNERWWQNTVDTFAFSKNQTRHYYVDGRFWSGEMHQGRLKLSASENEYHAGTLQGNHIITAEPASFFSAKFVASTDFGMQWHNPLLGSKKDDFRERKAFVTASGHLVNLVNAFAEPRREIFLRQKGTLQVSDNRGQSWRVLHEIPPTCPHLLRRISTDDRIYLNCLNGDILASNDLGKTWQHVYHFDPSQLDPAEHRITRL